ncbi:MAG: hypothetical protein AAGA01_06335 [Cyanobacteria bacterium P01_E01_bin.43]
MKSTQPSIQSESSPSPEAAMHVHNYNQRLMLTLKTPHGRSILIGAIMGLGMIGMGLVLRLPYAEVISTTDNPVTIPLKVD